MSGWEKPVESEGVSEGGFVDTLGDAERNRLWDEAYKDCWWIKDLALFASACTTMMIYRGYAPNGNDPDMYDPGILEQTMCDILGLADSPDMDD